MAKLFSQLKADALSARKARDSARSTPLTTQIGELETAAKNSGHEPTDAEVITAIKKTLKSIDETLRLAPSDALTAERALFATYLPKQMTREELVEAVQACITSIRNGNSPVNTGAIMKMMKQHFDGAYDGKMASNVIKELLV